MPIDALHVTRDLTAHSESMELILQTSFKRSFNTLAERQLCRSCIYAYRR